jgi:hypothetical protein
MDIDLDPVPNLCAIGSFRVLVNRRERRFDRRDTHLEVAALPSDNDRRRFAHELLAVEVQFGARRDVEMEMYLGHLLYVLYRTDGVKEIVMTHPPYVKISSESECIGDR